MANTYTVTRGHIIYGITLPLALLLGYLLAEPLDSSSLAIVVLVLSVLMTPLLIKWYYPALVLTFNSAFYFAFLPGSPPAWLVFAFLGFMFALLNRCIDPSRRLLVGGPVAWSLLALAGVIGLTAVATGGMGMAALGSSAYGGRRYVFIAAAIISYFVLASRPIPPSRATLYIALFFLPGFTSLLGNLAYKAGHGLDVLFLFVMPSSAITQASAEMNTFGADITRITGWLDTSNAVCLWMLARYGVGGLLDFAKPWRLGCFVLAFGVGLTAGFRSFAGFMGLVICIMFFVEGLHKTRRLLVVLLLGAVCAVSLVAFAKKMPLSIQRALSFLPIEMDPIAVRDARGSTTWRLDMWKLVAPDVPRYLLRGKGYTINPTDLAITHENASRGHTDTPAEWAIVSGDYHNGPLSVLIPFGVWGVLALGWFFYAGGELLYRNCLYGRPELRLINQILFSYFVARVLFFVFLVGGLSSDLPYFVFLVGLGVSMNRGAEQQAESAEWEMLPRPERI